jgi:hypothetical protein
MRIGATNPRDPGGSCFTNIPYGEVEDYTVNVLPGCTDPTITLQTGSDDDQDVCENTAIDDIVYTITDAASVNVTGLPAGVSGTGTSTFTISGTPNAGVSGTFNYTVTAVAETGCTNETVTGTITVNDLPEITTQPEDLTLCEGESGSFSVTTSAGSPIYQWQYSTPADPTNWVNVPDAAGVISGATTDELQILSAAIGWNGYNISCLITENGCETRSETAVLTVNDNVTPTFTQVEPICSGESLSALPTTSNNGITGSWAPALNNTTTTEYTFTPDAGQCATTTTMTITVNDLPAAPTAGSVSTTYDGTTYTATATAPSGASVVWYDADSGGNVLAGPPSRTNAGTSSAWAETVDDNTGCKSAT